MLNYPKLHNTHYSQTPHGRVVWNIDKFMVHVGKRAKLVQDELTQLIEDTFHLPYFEFVYDEPMEQ